jgi:ABC-type iron transport system FetAB permease component
VLKEDYIEKMHINELSVWGVLPVLLLLALGGALLWLMDRRLLRGIAGVRVSMPALSLRQWLSVLFSSAVGSAVMSGCLLLSLPSQLFWPVAVFMLWCLLKSVSRCMLTYVRCYRHTEHHRLYMLANDATLLEAVIPCVRRALRASLLAVLWQRSSPLMVGMPFLFLGLLIGGCTLTVALLLTVLLWLSVLAATVLASVLALWLVHQPLLNDLEWEKNGKKK